MVKMIDNYMLRQCIGQGTFGKVYKATHTKKQGDYAVKIIPIQKLNQNAKLQQCTFNQVKILSTIGLSNNIVRYYQMLKTKNNYYFIYQYCNGGTLLDKIKKDGLIPQKKALIYFQQLLQAFKVLVNLKIMHRDIKAQNIFFHNDCIKLGDFGFCKNLGPQENLAKTMLGSPIYMAPQVLKGQPYTTKADIWSLGVILYQMLYGYCPFQSHSIAMLINTITNTQVDFPTNPIVSQTTQSLIKKMLTKDYYRRIGWIQLFNLNHVYVQSNKNQQSPSKLKNTYNNNNQNNNKSPYKSYGNFRSQLSGSVDTNNRNNNSNDNSDINKNFRFGTGSTAHNNNNLHHNNNSTKKQNSENYSLNSAVKNTNNISNSNISGNKNKQQKKVFYSQRYMQLMNSMSIPMSSMSNIGKKQKQQSDKFDRKKQRQEQDMAINVNTSVNREKEQGYQIDNIQNNQFSSPSKNYLERQKQEQGQTSIMMNQNINNSFQQQQQQRQQQQFQKDSNERSKQKSATFDLNLNMSRNSNSKITSFNNNCNNNNSSQNISMNSRTNITHLLDNSLNQDQRERQNRHFSSLQQQAGQSAQKILSRLSPSKADIQNLNYQTQIKSQHSTHNLNQIHNINNIQTQKRSALLKTHQQSVLLLKQSISILQTRQLQSISKAYQILSRVKDSLKQITNDIQITQVHLLDLSSLVNYQVIQVDRLIVQVRQEMMKLKIQIPKAILNLNINGNGNSMTGSNGFNNSNGSNGNNFNSYSGSAIKVQ